MKDNDNIITTHINLHRPANNNNETRQLSSDTTGLEVGSNDLVLLQPEYLNELSTPGYHIRHPG